MRAKVKNKTPPQKANKELPKTTTTDMIGKTGLTAVPLWEVCDFNVNSDRT